MEPNSDTGRAVKDMINHWEGLTAFLCVPNAPLDNNICERALKSPSWIERIPYFLELKTTNVSVTCPHEPHLYLWIIRGEFLWIPITLLVGHEQVKAAPTSWMPWNYTSALSTITTWTHRAKQTTYIALIKKTRNWFLISCGSFFGFCRLAGKIWTKPIIMNLIHHYFVGNFCHLWSF